jgi:hypothetical protein
MTSTTGWTTGRSGFDPRQMQRIFPLASVSRPALGPTQPPVQWVPGVLSPGLKRGRGVMLTTHPHLVPRSWMSRSYTSSPPKRLHGVQRDCFTFYKMTSRYRKSWSNVNNPALYSGDPGSKSRPGNRLYWLYLPVPPGNPGIAPWITPLPFPFKPFITHYSLTAPAFDAILFSYDTTAHVEPFPPLYWGILITYN